MSKTTKRSLLYALGLLVLIAFAMWLRYASRNYFHSPAVNYLRSAIYLLLFSVWCYSLWARIVQVQVRHYMLAISALMVLWILLRSIKFSIDNTDAERLLWYFYYFPMLFIPMLSVFVSQSLGKGEDFRLPRWTKLLYLPTLLLLLLVLTNDLHQQVFSFPSGILSDREYRYEVGFFFVLGWEVLWTSAKNISKGQVFDENFLMSVATIAAFCIGDFAEGMGVMLFYKIGELFEDIAVDRSRSQIMDAVDMRPETVNRIHGDDIENIPAEDAQIGDILQVRPGDRIPLDGIVTEGESRIDTSPVTGEPVPVTATAGTEVVSGCVNEQGLLNIKVTKPLSESMVTRILDSVENAAAGKPKIDKFITKFAKIYTPIVVILAVLTAIIPSLITGDWGEWITTAITFLVISCPCALVISVPLAFFAGIGAGSKLGILFKGGISIEALKNVKAIIMDKTGTITKGNFVVQKITAAADLSEGQIIAMAAACEASSTHPIALSIMEEAAKRTATVQKAESIEEISGKGIKAKLAEGEALCGNRKLMDQFGIDISRQESGEGTEIFLALGGKFAGHITIADTIKSDAVDAIAAIKADGLIPAMLTGDAAGSANAVARTVGIADANVHAQLLPEDKLNALKEIRKQNGAVMFVGDGINDAPVLAGADVGAAMGSGADAAIEAADVVFMNSSVSAIPQAIKIARATGRISMQNVIFALAVKLLVLVLGFVGFANIWAAVFADTGVAMLCILNSMRILLKKFK